MSDKKSSEAGIKTETEEEAPKKIVFKKVKKKREFRKRKASDDVDAADEDSANKDGDGEADGDERSSEVLRETLEIQRLRQRQGGVSTVTLASGVKLSKVEELTAADPEDPFKIKTGGLVDLKKAKAIKAYEDGDVKALGDKGEESSSVVGTQFSKETRIRDEDEEMRKFIEVEMEKRRGNRDKETGKDAYMTPEERALMSLPDELMKSTFRKNEEMLSSQMLSGIPEVDLGIEEKIRNIEATEEAKKRLAAQAKKKSKPSGFVPTNLAVNFKQPDRFKTDIEELEQSSGPRKRQEEVMVTQRTVRVGDMPQERVISVPADADANPTRRADGGSKATDDLHLTKFKSHFQRK